MGALRHVGIAVHAHPPSVAEIERLMDMQRELIDAFSGQIGWINYHDYGSQDRPLPLPDRAMTQLANEAFRAPDGRAFGQVAVLVGDTWGIRAARSIVSMAFVVVRPAYPNHVVRDLVSGTEWLSGRLGGVSPWSASAESLRQATDTLKATALGSEP